MTAELEDVIACWTCRIFGHTREHNSYSITTSEHVEIYCGRCGVQIARRLVFPWQPVEGDQG